MSMKTNGYGYLVADPKLEEMVNGDKKNYCVKFLLSTTEYIKSSNKKLVHFFQFEAFDSGAKSFCDKAKKGDLIIVVSAYPRQYRWVNEDEEKRSKITFRLEEFRVIKQQKNENEEESIIS